MDLNLTEEQRDFVTDKAKQGFDADEIKYLMSDELDLEITPTESTLAQYIESEEAQDLIQIKESVTEKKAQITKEDLLETLVSLKDNMMEWEEQLQGTEHGMTRNEAVKNIVSVTNKIGELIGELDKKTVERNNIVKVDEMHNYVEENITQVIQHLPSSEKRSIVEQLEEDDDIEDFVIKRKGE